MEDKKEKKIFGFHKNIFNLGLVSFFTDISSEMIYPILPLFLSSVLGVPKSVIGLIEGIAEGAGSILRVVSGWLSDKINKRKEIVIFGYSLSTITKPFLAVANSGLAVLIVRIIDRTGKALRNPPRDAIVAHSIDKSERGKAFGLQRAMDDAGAVFGPLLCFGLLYLFSANYRLIFLLSFIPAAIAVAILVLFVSDKKDGKAPHEKIIFENAFTKEFGIFIFVTVIFSLGNSSNAFLFLRAQDFGVPVYMIPLTWVLYNGVSSVSAVPAGVFSDKMGRRNVMVLGFIMYAIVYLGFAFWKSAFGIWVLMALYGVFFGLTEGVGRAYVADLVNDKTKLGTAYGIYHTAVGISIFFASFFFGLIWQYIGAEVAFLLGGSLALISAVILLIFLRE